MSDRLTPQQRAAIADLIGDAKPANAKLLNAFGEAIRDCREHEHPKGEDFYCLNLAAWMGERVGLALRRLLDAEVDAEFWESAARKNGELYSAAENQRDEARAELAKYVGKEPTIAEEMQYLSECLNAVHDLCNRVEAFAGQAGQPVPEWVEQVRAVTDGSRPQDPNDKRRRIYIDGKGDGWIDLSVDAETGEQGLSGITNPWNVASVDEVRDDTGSLREIGRCW